MKSLSVAVIGLGSMGKNHARVCASLPETELRAVADINEEAAETASERYGAESFGDYRELYGRVEAAIVVSPTKLHYEITKDLLEHNIHVLVEKPITVSSKEADTLVKIAEERGLTLQVGHLERFNPAVIKLQSMLKNPVLIEVHRLSGPTKRNLDVGIVWDLMIHDFDILLSFYNSPAEYVSALGYSVYSEHEDVANVQLRLGNGAIASLTASRNSGERRRCMKITEDDGRVYMLDFIEQSLTVSLPGENGLPLPEETIPIEKDEPLKLEIRSFAEAVLNKRRPVVSGADGERALELAAEVYKRMQIFKK